MTTTRERARSTRGRATRAPATRAPGTKAAGARARLDEALAAALDLHDDSPERWGELKRRGATDAQIWHALRAEFGKGGGSQTEGGIQFAYHGGVSAGDAPKFWIGTSAAHTATERPTIAGARLVAAVRELLAIPPLGSAAGDAPGGVGDEAESADERGVALLVGGAGDLVAELERLIEGEPLEVPAAVAMLERVERAQATRFADLQNITEAISSLRKSKRRDTLQRERDDLAHLYEKTYTLAADALGAESVEALRRRVEGDDAPAGAAEGEQAPPAPRTLDELEHDLASILGMINAHDAEIIDKRTTKRRRKQLEKDRAPYLAAYEAGLAELRERFAAEADAAQTRIEESAAREQALAVVESEQRARLERLLALGRELENTKLKARDRQRLERDRAEVRESYVGAFRKIAAEHGGHVADDVRLRVEALPETSDDERAKLAGDLEAEQGGRWFRLAEIDRQLGESATPKKQRTALERERSQTGAAYSSAYTSALPVLGVKVIEEIRARVEGDTSAPIFTPAAAATPAIAGAGAHVEQNPDLVFDYTGEITLGEHDIATRGKRLAELHGEIEKLTKEKEQTVAGYKARIGTLEDESKKLFEEISAGVATAEVKVYERRDYSRKVVEFIRAGTTDQVVGSREMKPKEYTPRLFT